MSIVPEPSNPLVRGMVRTIRGFELLVIGILILLMMMVVTVSILELGVILWTELNAPPRFLLNLEELLHVLGFFMMVLIGLELLESIKNYLTESSLHVEVVLLVAMIAVARKVIILDVKDMAALQLIGTAALLLALSGAYLMLKIALRKPPKEKS
jgi:uncharacterized membrane protein (DUF373 family)